MKNSPYFDTFSVSISRWVQTLSEISESVELVESMTKQWLYLESIFSGSDEIRRQLPSETVQFNAVNKNWRMTMSKWAELKMAKTLCLIPGQFEKLLTMQRSLELIERSLSDYLETKRMAFPRFYFLSDDELLSILGNAKQPDRVQRHFRSLFGGIDCLILRGPTNAVADWQALGYRDRLNEQILFVDPVPIRGAVESWLRCIEHAMKSSLRTQLAATLLPIKSQAAPKKKREHWIRCSVGQLLVLSAQARF